MFLYGLVECEGSNVRLVKGEYCEAKMHFSSTLHVAPRNNDVGVLREQEKSVESDRSSASQRRRTIYINPPIDYAPSIPQTLQKNPGLVNIIPRRAGIFSK